MTVADILSQTMQLPETDRAEIARQVLLTLPPAVVQEKLQSQWVAEIQARLAAYDRGDMEASDWDEVAARLEETLDRKATS